MTECDQASSSIGDALGLCLRRQAGFSRSN
jgi:hypothetical protein